MNYLIPKASLLLISFAAFFGFLGGAFAQEINKNEPVSISVNDSSGNIRNYSLRNMSDVKKDTEAGFDVATQGSTLKDVRPSFELTTSTTSTRVEISAGQAYSSRISNEKFSYNSTLFKLSSPINKSSSNTDLATLDGLANSTSLEFVLRRVVRNGAKNLSATQHTAREKLAHAICERVEPPDERAKKCNGDVFVHEPYLTDAVAEKFGLALYEEKAATKVYGLSGKIGYEEFSYRDLSTFDKQKNEKVPYSFSAFAGYIPAEMQTTIFIVGAEYQHAYKAADSQTLCDTSTIMNGIQECFTGSFAAPVKDNKTLTYFEVRHMFADGLLGDLGIKVRYTHDFENDVNGVDVPIYLLRNKDKNLTGGVRLGWRDDTDDLTAGIFVGAAFSLFD